MGNEILQISVYMLNVKIPLLLVVTELPSGWSFKKKLDEFLCGKYEQRVDHWKFGMKQVC